MKNIKKNLCIFFIVCMSLFVIPLLGCDDLNISLRAGAADSGIYTYKISDGEAIIVDVADSVSGDVVIPDRFGVFKVTKIGENAFNGCDNVKKITIGRYIKDFYSNSFSNCSVTEFSVNKNNNFICSDSDGLIYNRNKTVLFAYPCGNERTEFTIPDGITRIFDRAFFAADNLNKINIPDTVTIIGKQAFAFCASLKTITFPENLTVVADQIFLGCINLRNVILSPATESIGNYAFAYCTRLSDVELTDKCSWISDGAFYYCSSLEEIAIAESVDTVGEKSFYGCFSLKKYEILSNTVSLENSSIGVSDKTFKNGVDAEDFALYIDSYISCSMFKDESSIRQAESEFSKMLDISNADICFGTMYCKEGSAAEIYARKIGINYKYIYHKKHTLITKTTAATTKKYGKTVITCTMCDFTESEIIPKIKSVKLSETSYICDGKKKTPSVIVKDSEGNTLKKNSDYTVKYSNGRKAVGTYTVEVAFKGNYSGNKTLEFTVTLARVKNINAVQNGKNTVLKWDSVKGANGYIIYQYDNVKKEYVKKSVVSKASVTVKNLKGTAKFKIKAYCKVNGKTVTGKASSVKKVNG